MGDVRCVLDGHRDLDQRAGALGPFGGDAHDGVDRLPSPHEDAADDTIDAPELLALLTAPHHDPLLVRAVRAGAGKRSEGRAPTRPPRPTAPSRRRRPPARRPAPSPLPRRRAPPPPTGAAPGAPAPARQPGLSRIDDALGAVPPAFRAVGLRERPREQHSPLPPDLVLRRRGAVRVQHVALEEHRVGDRARGVESVGHDRASPARFLQQPLDHEVPGRERCAARYRRRVSRVSRPTVTNARFG